MTVVVSREGIDLLNQFGCEFGVDVQGEYQIKESTLTLQYRKHWKLEQCIREIGQNTLDELETLPTIHGRKGWVVIEDNGGGLSLAQFFLLGVSEKDNENARGQYGEGLKMALLVLKRLGYDVVVRSRDWIATVQKDNFNGYDVINYIYGKTRQYVNGTQIYIRGIEKEDIDKIVEYMFLSEEPEETVFSHDSFGKVLDGKYRGMLYSKRIYVKHEESLYFGYDLYNVRLGVDRMFPDSFDVRWYIGVLLSRITDERLINQIYDVFSSSYGKQYLEATITHFEPNIRYKELFYKKYGENACIATTERNRRKLREIRKTLVVIPNQKIVDGLIALGIKTDYNILQEWEENLRKAKYKSFYDLTKRQQQNIEKVLEVIQATGFFNINLKSLIDDNIIVFYRKLKNDTTLGFYDPKEDIIGISLTVLNQQYKLFPVLVEELIHFDKNYKDFTREFQNAQGDFLARLFKLLPRKIKKEMRK